MRTKNSLQQKWVGSIQLETTSIGFNEKSKIILLKAPINKQKPSILEVSHISDKIERSLNFVKMHSKHDYSIQFSNKQHSQHPILKYNVTEIQWAQKMQTGFI